MSQRSNGADTSPTHPKPANAIPEEQILDAAYELLLAIGMQRMTMADIARYAGVSRATLYRRWGGVREVVGALITREWAALSQDVTTRVEAQPPEPANGARSLLVATVVEMARRIRTHPILRKIVDLDPDFLLPYLLRRRGTSTNEQLELLEGGLRAGMDDGSVRTGDPGLLARSVLLATWSFTLTAPALVDAPDGTGAELDRLDAELTLMLDRYLSPATPPTTAGTTDPATTLTGPPTETPPAVPPAAPTQGSNES
ncbi:TetR/AcrR family transcriptional regulator [Streptomyces sp. XM4193]|uniref:TetR/AcrR family transcriptional regulator n=1 Tax=Streptomyces sp. XM4193 TaxID=2929782 RepID=UPI001FF856C1|nr:TetR/AcrR family transcriptional regulator [Streptomyces sp. XM4193]MCK1798338.1 TetR/AcrR family transcriptional regulator [Streptomyces sp. XM4193]